MLYKKITTVALSFILALLMLSGCADVDPNSGDIRGLSDAFFTAHFVYVGNMEMNRMGQEFISCATEFPDNVKGYLQNAGFVRDWDTFFDTQQLIIRPRLMRGANSYHKIQSVVYTTGFLIITLTLGRIRQPGCRTVIPSIAFISSCVIEISRICADTQIVFVGEDRQLMSILSPSLEQSDG